MTDRSAGWYRDPTGRHRQRWWDEAYWAADVQDGDVVIEDWDPRVLDRGQRSVVSSLESNLRDGERVVAVLAQALAQKEVSFLRKVLSTASTVASIAGGGGGGGFSDPPDECYAVVVTDQRVLLATYRESKRSETIRLRMSEERSQVGVTEWSAPTKGVGTLVLRSASLGGVTMFVSAGRFSGQAESVVAALNSESGPQFLPPPSKWD